MPKTPIKDRTGFFVPLPRDGGVKIFDWCIVNTSVGACVEPRPILDVSPSAGVANMDTFDASCTRFRQANKNTFFRLNGTAGDQLPRDYNV